MKIGHFSILEKLGDGPFSSVYKAEDVTCKGRIVTIKIWHAPPRYLNFYDAFIQDVQPFVALRHAHILTMFEANIEDDILYFVSMYASGGSIKDLRGRYPQQIIPIDEAVSIITQIGKALHYAYQANIHHSLKPENILFGGGNEAFLSDFNITSQLAKIGIKRDDSFGYSYYPSLRQLNDFGRERANQYKLGHLAYELCTGKKPVYQADRWGDWPIAPFVFNRQIPGAVEQAILCALRLKGPAYPDTAAFLEALNGSDAYDNIVLGDSAHFEETKKHQNSRASDVIEEKLTKSPDEYLADGEKYYGLSLYEEALQMFDKVLQTDPRDTRAHVRKGKALLGLKRYEEAFQSFQRAILLQPPHPVALVGRGEALFELAFYEQALESFDEALKFNPQLPEAHAGKGHSLFALNQDIDALKAYTKAIQYRTDNVNCFLNSGEILTNMSKFEDAVIMYDQALQLTPELVAAHEARANALFELKRYQEALQAYQLIISLNEKNIMAYVRIGDIQTVFRANEEATVSYDKALALVKDEQNLNRLWLLTNPASAPFRSTDIQFELLRQFIIKAPGDARITIALASISTLYDHLFNSQCLAAEKFQHNVRVLSKVLENLPEEKRSEALSLISGNDDIRMVQLLIILKPFTIAGLATLAHTLTLRLKPEPRADDLFVRFYHVLDSYGVPFEDSDWLFCQELMEERLYLSAKSILIDLVKRRPAPDIIWLLAESLEKLNESPQNQVETLHYFINVATPIDARLGQAWKRIGELFEQQLHNGIEAMRAYKHATQYELKFQQLQDFQSGHWRDNTFFAFPL